MNNLYEKLKLKHIFIALAVLLFLNFLLDLSAGVTYDSDKNNEFDWNDEEDVEGFLEWKEDNGTGWSDN